MTKEQVTSLIRTALIAGGGVLIKQGYVDAGSWTIFSTGLATILVSAAWSLWERRANGLIASAANLGKVQTIVTDAATANVAMADNTKVISVTQNVAQKQGSSK